MIVKSFKNMFPKELMPFFEGSSLLLREIGISLGNNHVLKEKEFKLSLGVT